MQFANVFVPNEILKHILYFLSNSERYSILTVCRLWYDHNKEYLDKLKYYLYNFEEFCEKGDLKAVKKCCEVYGLDASVIDDTLHGPLYEAVAYCQLEIIKYLIEVAKTPIKKNSNLFCQLCERIDYLGGDIEDVGLCKEMIIYLLDNGAPVPDDRELKYVYKGIRDVFYNHPAAKKKNKNRRINKLKHNAIRERTPNKGGLIKLISYGAQDRVLVDNSTRIEFSKKNEKYYYQKKYNRRPYKNRQFKKKFIFFFGLVSLILIPVIFPYINSSYFPSY